jgi:hypothetical protein
MYLRQVEKMLAIDGGMQTLSKRYDCGMYWVTEGCAKASSTQL